jgi:hypothetical protein
LRRSPALAALALILAGCARTQPPPWAHALGYGPAELHRVEVPRDGMPRVAVDLDGRGVRLLFDTANMTGLFLDPRLAGRLGLPVVGTWTPVDADGRRSSPQRIFGVRALTAFGRTWPDQQASERASAALEGAIGPRYLVGARYTLDARRGWLAVSFRPAPPAEAPDGLPLIAASCCPGMPVVHGTLNGRPVLVQLDTGKSRTCVDPALAARLGLPRARTGFALGDVGIGPLRFRVPDAKPLDFGGLDTGLGEPILLGLGSDVLGKLVMTVDPARNRISLSR